MYFDLIVLILPQLPKLRLTYEKFLKTLVEKVKKLSREFVSFSYHTCAAAIICIGLNIIDGQGSLPESIRYGLK
jgi:hypothetical protein